MCELPRKCTTLTLAHTTCNFHSQFDVTASSVQRGPGGNTTKQIVVPPEKRPPGSNNNPVVIEYSIFVVDINSINVEDMDFRVDMFVHQKWRESRLTLTDDLFEDGDDYITLPPENFENLWQPDPYFLNSKVAGKWLPLLGVSLSFSRAVIDPFKLSVHFFVLS
jgi:hypothetical protein